MTGSPGPKLTIPSMRGTILSEYDIEMIDRHSFSQSRQGPFAFLKKDAALIHSSTKIISGEV